LWKDFQHSIEGDNLTFSEVVAGKEVEVTRILRGEVGKPLDNDWNLKKVLDIIN